MNHAKLLEMQKQLDGATNANDVLSSLDALVKSLDQRKDKQNASVESEEIVNYLHCANRNKAVE